MCKEHRLKGHDGRFGPGLPRVSDGSLLFLMHLLSKMRPVKDGGSRVAIVLSGSPLFTGGAGSGESEIRAKAQAFIDLLREHRAALIAAAVTGQIDVRGDRMVE